MKTFREYLKEAVLSDKKRVFKIVGSNNPKLKVGQYIAYNKNDDVIGVSSKSQAQVWEPDKLSAYPMDSESVQGLIEDENDIKLKIEEL